KSLLRIELGVRAKQGRTLPVGDYLARFPEHAAVITSVYPPTAKRAEDKAAPIESWYYLRNNVRIGPFTFELLKQIVRAGDLRPKDKVGAGDSSDWLEA